MKRKRVMVTALIVLGVLIAGHVVGAFIAAGMIVKPHRRTLAEAAEARGYATPADFRRPYSDLEVQSYEATIRGWLVPSGSLKRRAVILIHGHEDNRTGMLEFLPILEPLEVNIALIDLRAHGESDGPYLTYGVLEREDLRAVVSWLIGHDLAEPGAVALVGYSLGGAIALQAAAIDPRVGAVIADGSFARLRPLIYRHARSLFGPAVTVVPFGIWIAEGRAAFSVWEASPLSVAGRIRCPVLLIQGEQDPIAPPSHAEALKAALGDRAEVWVQPGLGHCEGLASDPVTYGRRVREFLTMHIFK